MRYDLRSQYRIRLICHTGILMKNNDFSNYCLNRK